MKLGKVRYLDFVPPSKRTWWWAYRQQIVADVLAVPGFVWAIGIPFALFGGFLLPHAILKVTAVFVAATIVVLSAISPKKSIYTIWFLLITEGAIRKWIAPGVQEFIYFGKDVLVIGIYVGTMLRGYVRETKGVQEIPKSIQGVLWVIVVYMVLELFNPRLASQVVGVFGLRNYLLYIGMLFITPYLFEDRTSFYKFLKVQIVFVVPVCILGIVQFGLPPDHPINRYANEMIIHDIATFGHAVGEERARITGPFSFISGFTSYLTNMVIMIMPFFFVSKGRKYLGYGTLLALLFGNMLMNGSRAPLLLSIPAVLLFVQMATFGEGDRHAARTIRRRLYVRFFLIGAVLLTMAFSLFQAPMAALMDRFTSLSDSEERIGNLYRRPLELVSNTGLFGYGPAMTHQATPSLLRMTKTYAKLPPTGEEEPVRIVKELGLFGLLLWYIMRGMFLIWNWQLFQKERDPFFRLIIAAILVLQLTSLPVHVVLNHTHLFMYWFFIGCLRIPAQRPVLTRRRRRYLA